MKPTHGDLVGCLQVPGHDRESPTCSCRYVNAIPGGAGMPLGVGE